MQIVESFDIPIGKILACDFTKAYAYVKRDIGIETSNNVNDDFIKDMMRMKAYVRMAFFVRQHEAFAFCYADIENAKAAIGTGVG